MSDLKSRLAQIPPERLRLLARQVRKGGPAAGAIARQPRTSGRFPLALAQERLWFLAQLAPGNPAYNNVFAFRFHGRVECAAMEAAFNELVRRHEALRTTFVLDGDKTVQVIAEPRWRPLPVIDLRALPAGEREAEARRIAAEEAGIPFDLAAGPLFRATLLHLADEESVVVGCAHHIVSDGWCADILTRELGILYVAFLRGAPSPLPELPLQYVDYAVWQRERMQGDVEERLLSYWKQQLDGLEVLPLPTDRPRPPVQSASGATLTFAVPPALTAALRELGRREGVTPFMVLLAAYQTLLHRWTGALDLAVGAPIANRGRSELENVIGFFASTLVLRGDLSGRPSFRELLRRVHRTCIAAYEHQEVPFERLVDVLHPVRDPARNPLFQVAFQFSAAPRIALPGTGRFAVSVFPIDRVTAKFDLDLVMWEGWDGFARLGGLTSNASETAAPAADAFFGTLIYNADLFERGTVQRMVDHFLRLLEGVAADPDRAVAALPLLSEAERVALSMPPRRTDVPPPVHVQLEAQAARRPDAIAVVSGAERLTYGELDARATALARQLRLRGIGTDSVVPLLAERSVRFLVRMLAILKAGGAFCPLDPDAPRERQELLLAELGAPLLDLDPPADAGHGPLPAVAPSDLAYVLFTSGSTGRPKAVAIEHGSLAAYVAAVTEELGLDDGGRFATVSTFAADLGNTMLFPALCGGGTLDVVPREATLDPDALARHFAAAPPDHLKIVPSHLAAMLRASDPAAVLPRKTLVLGGEALPRELVLRVRELAPECAIVNHYGPTETTVGATAHRVDADALTRAAVPIGRPLPHAVVRIVDAERELVPVGVPGEICIGGAGVARGYLGRPDLTAERFVPMPPDGARMYRTGDHGRWLPDGTIEFLGRADDQVKVRGFRVEPAEVEAVLAQHPAVRRAVVLADRREGDTRLVAYAAADGVASADLLAFLRTRLPEPMVPAAAVVLADLPLTANGKIDRRALPKPLAERAESGAPPRTELERVLVDIWREALGVPHVGIHDNFFDLGGHSLLLIRVWQQIRERLQLDLSMLELMTRPTIASLSAFAAERESAPAAARPPRERAAIRRDRLAQQRRTRIGARP
jgi:amino acid adenylation domain-containing protein